MYLETFCNLEIFYMSKFCIIIQSIDKIDFIDPSPFPKRQILDSSKLTDFAVGNFKFYENGGKFSKSIENAVGKGEIACYKQFLLFPTVFSKDLLQTRKNQGLFGKGFINPFPHNDTF